jgi:hypothetical protein
MSIWPIEPSSHRHQNAGVPLTSQNSYADSSRAGQFYNSVGYAGVSSTTYGTLTFFRQNALTLDAVYTYDPLGASYAFSPLGWQGITCGVGDTAVAGASKALETARPTICRRVEWQAGAERGQGICKCCDRRQARRRRDAARSASYRGDVANAGRHRFMGGGRLSRGDG